MPCHKLTSQHYHAIKTKTNPCVTVKSITHRPYNSILYIYIRMACLGISKFRYIYLFQAWANDQVSANTLIGFKSLVSEIIMCLCTNKVIPTITFINRVY